MNLHLIVKKGVYRHSIKGAFTTLTQAIDQAIIEVTNDAPEHSGSDIPDHYHSYEVLLIEPNKPVDDLESICEIHWNEKQNKAMTINYRAGGVVCTS